ncbi:hypothetical protein MHU86_8915 [Fragilaria crotonensis]|nr:hypothetical protein MHU86_8915 [Fragilaria crotonensis]
MRQKLVNSIRDQNYADLISLLQLDSSYADQGLFTLAKMTGLEWAVYWEDWKMTAIFFIFGADPKNNIFDGVMEMPPGYVPLPGFTIGRPIPGFDGLFLLLREEDDIEYGIAFLMIMQICYRGEFDCRNEYKQLLENLVTVDADFKLGDMKDRIMTSMLALRRCGLPNELAVRIVGEMVVETLYDGIHAHAFHEPVPTNQEPWKGLVPSSTATTA